MTTTRLCRIPKCGRTRPAYSSLCGPCRWLRRVATPVRRGVSDQDVRIAVIDRRPTPGLNREERRLVSRTLTALDLSAHEIARILAVDPRTVVRYRAADRIQEN